MDRYQKLEKWNGKWMNLWTRTIVHDHSRENEEEKKDDKKDKTNSGSDDGDVVIKGNSSNFRGFQKCAELQIQTMIRI